MNTKSLQVFVAVAIGIFVGLMGGWKLTGTLGPIWWVLACPVGMIAGGLIAYIMNDPPGVGWGICRAFYRTWCDMTDPETQRKIKLLFYPFLWISLGLLHFFAWFSLGFALIYSSDTAGMDPKIMVGVVIGWDIIPWFIFSYLFAATAYARLSIISEGKVYEEISLFARHLLLVGPLAVLFWWIPYGLVRSPALIRYYGSLALEFNGRFLWHLNVAIHSKVRLICFVDAALFVGLFFVTQSLMWAFTAALLGGCFGVLNYAYIAHRLYKVQPD